MFKLDLATTHSVGKGTVEVAGKGLVKITKIQG